MLADVQHEDPMPYVINNTTALNHLITVDTFKIFEINKRSTICQNRTKGIIYY